MGAVYRARDEASGRLVAFKQLLASKQSAKRGMFEALFEREYHTLVRLKHPRIIEVLDYGITPSGPYYTMELLEGKDLQQLAPVPYREACGHLRDIASSLALIHAHRLLHRDLSPRNMRLADDGRVKLLDFGGLCGFGLASDLVGTAMCMAPEVLRRSPLDQRTDLFGLGAVGYWLLTGRHAYPARHVEELPALWQRPPQVPSALVPGIPHALDQLIMSLLNIEPLARPSSAAAVIDQLTAIGELPADESDYAVESYLSSGKLVGRHNELSWMRRRLARALEGRGAEVVIEGTAGVGKSRLLHEVGLEAQLKGMIALRVDAQATPGPFGAARALALQLLAVCPEIARSAVGPYAELLGHLSAELWAKLEPAQLAELDGAGERRVRLRSALHEWFLDVARQRPLLLAIDNLQAADENTAAFLAGLGRKARRVPLVLIASVRSGDRVLAPGPVRALRKHASRLKLSGVDAQACEELCKSLFGEVANAGRIAHLLYDKSAGNPQLCMELAQLLVKRRVIRYAMGAWVLPQQISASELPSHVDELASVKLSGLSADARALAEILSIQGEPVSLESCLLLAEQHPGLDTHGALDELLTEQVLVIDSGCYDFGQGALRQAVLERMDDAQRQKEHMRAAEALLARASEDRLELRMQAAFHLLQAGCELRGADLLANTSRAVLKSKGGGDGAEQIVQALHAAVAVYDRHGRSSYEIARLLFPMIPFAWYSADWRLILSYAERAVGLGLEITGLTLAKSLKDSLGPQAALQAGLASAGAAFKREQARGLEYSLQEALHSLCAMTPAAAGTLSVCMDLPAVERLRDAFEPCAWFGQDEFPYLIYEFLDSLVLAQQGRERDALDRRLQTIERFKQRNIREQLGENHWRSLYGGMLYTAALMSCHCSMPEALGYATELDELGIRAWAMNAAQIRMLYHAYSGQSDEVQRQRERVELFAVQGSGTWQSEIFIPIAFSCADILSSDTLAARRNWEQLARRSRDLPTLRIYAEAARAGYLMLRGELDAAIALYESLLPAFPLRGVTGWMQTRAFYGRALNRAGQPARAKQVLSEALAASTEEDESVLMHGLETHRQLALAHAGLGEFERAEALMEQLLARFEHHPNPMLVGLLHEARAEVALGARDQDAFDQHLVAMQQRFRGTRNPALLAHWGRLCEQAVRAGLRPATNPEPRPQPVQSGSAQDTSSSIERTLAEISVASDRCEYALQVIVKNCKARAGYLYMLEHDGLRLAAASHGSVPPKQLEHELLARSVQYQSEPPPALLSSSPPGSGPVGTSGDELEGVRTVVSGERSRMRAVARGERARIRRSTPPPFELPVALLGNNGHGSVATTSPSASTSLSPHLPIDATQSTTSSCHSMVMLALAHEQQHIVVGGVILELESARTPQLDPLLLHGIAKALHEHHVSSSAHLAP